jgi:hypothetical protein
MIDALLKVVASDAIDVSADINAAGENMLFAHAQVGDNASGATTSFIIRRSGLPLGLQAIVVMESVSTGTTTDEPFTILAEYSTDNGTTYHAIGTCDFKDNTVAPAVRVIPLGLIDRYAEDPSTDAHHLLRFSIMLGIDGDQAAGLTSSSTIDPTFSVYLTAGERVRGSVNN